MVVSVVVGLLFLDEKVCVVDAQGSQLRVRALEHHQETAEGYVCATKSSAPLVLVRQRSVPGRIGDWEIGRFGSQSLSLDAVLKPVDLAMTHVIVHVGQRGLAADVAPPPLLAVAVPVEREGRREDDLQVLAHKTREQLDVDVERHLRLVVGRIRRDARHAIVLGLVIVCDGKGVFEELRVAGRHFVVLLETRSSDGLSGELFGGKVARIGCR